MPPASGALYMLAVGAVEIAVLMRGRIDFGALRRHPWLFLAVGLLVGVNTNMGFAAVKYLDPGTASVLSRMSILFGVALGILWLRERLTRIEALGAVVAIAGVVAVSAQPGDYFRWGSAIIIGSTFLYALHSAVVKRYANDIPFGEFMFFRVVAVAAVLFALALGQGALVWPAATAWGWIIVAGSVNVVIGRGLYYLALRRLDMSLLTIILTLSPVVTWLWSIVLFGGWPTAQEICGGAATLAGVVIVTSSRAGLSAARSAAVPGARP
jgi:drug/metabolite transporter (DMT)-like permease